jgi:hypothetical protein
MSFIGPRYIWLYRLVLLVATAALAIWNELFLLFFCGWGVLSAFGLFVRYVLLGGRRKENEEAPYGVALFPLDAFVFLWQSNR